MSLQKLDIYNVRNIRQATLKPSSALNFIYGANGSGKSALLEAIFILGRATSFRTSIIKNIIYRHAQELIVSGQALQKNGLYTHIGIQLNAKSCDIHIDQENKQKRAALAYALPIQIIHPLSYQLLDGGSIFRREFMDWGIFNQNSQFLFLWRRYKKILAHRNTLLKSKSLRQIQTWDAELVAHAILIAQFRSQYIQNLQPVFLAICRQFLNIGDINLAASAGWNEELGLQQVLLNDVDKDCRYGFTQHGPHRGDFHVLINHKFAKDYVSRGQLKLLVLALKLAQVQLLQQKFSKIGCILIDDLAAELDLASRTKLLHYLSAMDYQAFLTATELQDFGDIQALKACKMFHVEQGYIEQVDVSCGTLL